MKLNAHLKICGQSLVTTVGLFTLAATANATIMLAADIGDGNGYVELASDDVNSAQINYVSSLVYNIPGVGSFDVGGGDVGTFDLSFTGGLSNSPGTESLPSYITNSTYQMYNNSDATQTIKLLFGAEGFETPMGNVALTSTLNGNMIVQEVGTDTAVSFQSWVNKSDSINSFIGDQQEQEAGPSGSLTSGLLGPSSIENISSGNSWGPLENTVLGSVNSDSYLIVNELVVTLEAGEKINFNAAILVTGLANSTNTPVPGPGTLGLFFLGLVGLVVSRCNSRS
jgi:hypothetical protein